ncbi:MAG: prolipoprotein diacylglyceryl transferase family protein [Myxococcota bacterium]
MHPILTVLELGGLSRPIGTYGVLIALGLVVSAALTARAAARAREDVGAAVACVGFMVAGGLSGAFLLNALVEGVSSGDPLRGLTTSPGLVFYGGPIGGFLAGWLTARPLGVPFFKITDLVVPALPAAHAVGRMGCFFGGCCHGSLYEGPLAVSYPDHPFVSAALRHPTPLYEAGLLLALAFVLALLPVRAAGSGRRLGIYAAAYAVIRAITELFRGDAVRGVWLGGAVSTSQLISVGILAFGVALIVRAGRPSAAVA